MADFGITEALLIASVAATAATAYTQYQGAKTQAAMQQQYNQQQIADDNAGRIQMYKQGATQEQYINDQSWEKQYENTEAYRAAKATALTSAGEGGITGTSVNALAASYDAQKGQYNSDLEYNRVGDINQTQLQ